MEQERIQEFLNKNNDLARENLKKIQEHHGNIKKEKEKIRRNQAVIEYERNNIEHLRRELRKAEWRNLMNLLIDDLAEHEDARDKYDSWDTIIKLLRPEASPQQLSIFEEEI